MKTHILCRAEKLAAYTVLMFAAMIAASAHAQEVIKSPNDLRTYLALELANGLRAVVVSDPGAVIAAASMDVHVGSGDDPRDREGLAHFLEHMLFLGTDQFPTVDDYQKYVSRNGGSQNAYTSYDRTNYHFDVTADALDGALQRFSRFFVRPLLNPQYVERERQVVHAEYSSGRKSDGRRSFSVFKRAINQAHPLSQFFVGSQDTLADRPGDAVRADLLEFHQTHYRAANMTLAVLGREPVEELAARVRALFADVPAGAGGAATRNVDLFEPGRLPLEVNIVPEREYRSVSLSFPVPPLKQHYRLKPLQYVAHLVGHEGPGSLVSLLRTRGLANSLSAGTGLSHADVATFQVRIGLTQRGLADLDSVVELVFALLKRIHDAGPEGYRYAEFQRMAELSFQYMDATDAGNLTQAIAHNLHDHAPADVLFAPYVLERFDASLTWQYLAALTPQNMLLSVTAPGLPADKRTPRFDAPYSLRAIDPARLERWRAPTLPTALRLPGPNKYLPDDLSLQVDASKHSPMPLATEPGFTLWHQQDTSFGVPRSSFFVNLRTRAANASALGSVQTQLLVSMLNEQLTEITYPAALAGMGVQLYKHLRGLSFRISGYSSRQAELVSAVVDALRKPDLDAARFARVKAAHRRSLNNQAKAQPYNQGLSFLTDLLLEPRWTRVQRLEALEQVELSTLRQFADEWLQSIDSVAMAHGNVTPAGATSLAQTLDHGLLSKVRVEDVPRGQVVKLRAGDYLGHVLPVPHNDGALVLYFQGQSKQRSDRAAHALAAQILSGPFYTDLRTRKQLGYVVFASSMPVMQVPGLAFVVQSPNTSTLELRQHADAFLRSATETLKGLPQAEFDRFRESLVERLLEPDKTLSARSNRYWREIDRNPGQFDEHVKLAAAVRSLTVDDVLNAFQRTVLGPERARVEVHAVPTQRASVTREALAEIELIPSVGELRATRARFEAE